MLAFFFGKKKTTKKSTKPSKALLKMAKKYRVKVYTTRGSKRVYKTTAAIKKLIKARSKVKRSRFGFGASGSVFVGRLRKIGSTL